VKQVVVIIQSTEPDRVREALRAAVGLGLRGDQVRVHAAALDLRDPWITRAVATLAQLGRPVQSGPPQVSDADVVEVWT
jgi:hypothetical protein